MLLVMLLLNSCIETSDTFNSIKLTSSKGEKIYINTLNWGVNDDYQYTVVSKDSNKLKERKDTIEGIRGLDPFIYKFSNDTLTIVCRTEKTPKIVDEFNSIHIKNITVENKRYIEILTMANTGKEGYHQVPE